MIRAACAVELLKLRRSRLMAATTVILLLVPALLATAFVAAAGAGGNDPLTVKARAMIPGPGWEGYLSGLVQVFATAGFLGMGIGVAWCFGREYADRTIVSLYASATPRGEVAAGKFVVLFLWVAVVAAALGPSAVLIGLLSGFGSPDADALSALGRLVALAGLTGALAMLVALFASIGRGYLPAFGGLIGLVVAAQVGVIAGLGDWFPLSSPALWAAGSPSLPSVSVAQLSLVPVTSALAVLGTVLWWRRAPLV